MDVVTELNNNLKWSHGESSKFELSMGMGTGNREMRVPECIEAHNCSGVPLWFDDNT